LIRAIKSGKVALFETGESDAAGDPLLESVIEGRLLIPAPLGRDQ
jgi:hypothetical protein